MASRLGSVRRPRMTAFFRGGFFLLTLVCVFGLGGSPDAATLFVTSTADSGSGSLREAVDTAVAGDSVEFLVTGTIELSSGPLVVDEDLTIRGPGAASLAISGGYASRVLDVLGGCTVEVSGLTIRDGGNWDLYEPATAIWNAGELLLTEVSVVENGWAYAPAASVLNDGTLQLIDSDVSGNSGDSVAGILNAGTGDLYLHNSSIDLNWAMDEGWYGAALTNLGEALIESSRIAANGGGVLNTAFLTMQDSEIIGNITYGAQGCVGLHNTGIALLSRVTVADNARYGGPGGICNEGEISIVNTTVSHNGGGYEGGGVWNAPDAVMRIAASTVTQNHAWEYATEITNLGVIEIRNSIVARAQSSPDDWLWACDNFGTILSLGGNLDDDGTCGFNASGDMTTEPLLGPLADNGGPTLTHALLQGSPAIDGVGIADCTDDLGAVLTTDQRGVPRPRGPACDIGAYEAEPEIDVVPLSLDFGDAAIGESVPLIVTISNLGATDLSVDDIRFQPCSGNQFQVTSAPLLPAVVPPVSEDPNGGTIDIEISFSPTVEGFRSAVLEILSDDADEGLVEVELGGSGTPAELPPEEQIALILEFYDAAVAEGTLIGKGPGRSADRRRRALRNMLEASGDLIQRGFWRLACVQLLVVVRRTDGMFPPPDFVAGEAAPTLAEMIRDLRASLGCAVRQCGDADGDGDVDRDDVQLARRHLARLGMSWLFGEQRCSSVSPDSMSCDIRDAVLMSRHLSGLPAEVGGICAPFIEPD